MSSNKPERIIKKHNFLTGLSDHNAIFISSKLTKKRLNYKSCNSKQIFKPKRQEQNLATVLSNFDWFETNSCTNVDKRCDLMYSSISDVLKLFQRKGTHKKQNYSLPWINSECTQLMKLRDKLVKKSLQCGLTTDRLNFVSVRNKVTPTLRMAKANYFMTVIDNAKGNCKLIWDNIKKLVGQPRVNFGT